MAIIAYMAGMPQPAFNSRSRSRARRFAQRFNPTDAVSDFKAVYAQAGPNRWRYMALAAAMTTLVFSLVVFEEHRILPRPPEITYINSWPADRSDAEIRASNIAHQRRKEAEQAEQARREEEVRGIYKTIGRLSGMDVDAIERRAKAEQAASARAEEQEAARLQSLQHMAQPMAQHIAKPAQ